MLAEGATLSLVDLARQAGVTVEVVLGLWRTLGVVVPNEIRPMFSERDVAFTAYIAELNPVGSHGNELLRVLGESLARVAEAAVTVYVQTVEPHLDVPDIDQVVWAQDLAKATRWPSASATPWASSSPTPCGTPSTASGSPRPR